MDNNKFTPQNETITPNTTKSQAKTKNDNNNVNVETQARQSNSQELVSGELRKLKTKGIKLFSNTNIRWVELDLIAKIFGYKINQNDPNYKEYQNLSNFVSFNPQTSLEDRNKSKWKFGFCVSFEHRNYTLYAQNEAEYAKWKNALTRVVNVFINYKNINLSVFKVALQTFAKPYLDELELESQQKLKEQEKNEKEEFPKVAPPQPEIAKVALPQPEIAKVEQEQSEIAKAAPPQPEIAKVAPPPEIAKVEQEQSEIAKAAPPQPEIAKVVPPQPEIAKIEQERSEKPEVKVNNVDLHRVQRKADNPKISDFYSEETQKFTEEDFSEAENSKHKKKVDIQLNFKQDVLAKSKNSQTNFEFNTDDLNDWDFYNEERNKIEGNKLINYNPVLKEQRLSLSPILKSKVKGYVTSNQENNVENLNILKSDKNLSSIEKEKEDANNYNSSDFTRKTLSNKQNISFVLEFAKINQSNNNNNIDLYGTHKGTVNNKNSSKSININNQQGNKNDIYLDRDEDYIEFKNFQPQKKEADEDARATQNKILNNNDNKDNNDYFNFSENVFVEDFHNLKDSEVFNKSVKKFESDINNGFIDERVLLLSQIKQREEEKKQKEIERQTKFNEDQITGKQNNFDFSKYLITKEQLLEEINNKGLSKQQKPMSTLYNTKKDFENFEFAISKKALQETSTEEKGYLNEPFDKEEKSYYKTFDGNKIPVGFKNDKNNYISKANTYRASSIQSDSNKFINNIVNNQFDKNVNFDEDQNKIIMKNTKENLQFTLADKDNMNFSKYNKKIYLSDKFKEPKATEYLNENNDKSLNTQNYATYESNYKHSKSPNKDRNSINNNLYNASAIQKQKLFDTVFGKKPKTLI